MKKILFILLFLGPYSVFSQSDTVPPTYKGMDVALMKFLKDNLRYPPFAGEHSIQGIVTCSFEVSESGIIDNIKILNSPGFDLDHEAIRLIKLMSGKWSSAIVNGVAVKKSTTLSA